MTIRVRIEHTEPANDRSLQVEVRYSDRSAPGASLVVEPGQAIEEVVWGSKQLIIREVPRL